MLQTANSFASADHVALIRGSRRERGTGGPNPSLTKSEVVIGFLRNTDTNAIDPMGPLAPIGRFVRPSVKNFDDK